MAHFDDLPPEILRIIAQLIYLDHLPRSLFRCIDPHGLPSTYPDGRLISSTQLLTKSALHALCLTNKKLYDAAKPLLWRRLQITLPYSFLLLLRTLGASRLAEAYEQLGGPQAKRLEVQDARPDVDDRMSFNAMLAAVGLARVTGGTIYSDRRIGHEATDTAGMELVWTEERGLHGEGKPSRYQVTFRQDESDMSDVHRYPRVLDFSTFTTQGMRRTVGAGEEERFVTPAKLLALITSVSYGLMAFGASSTMDSALSVEVLEALLFREGEHLASSDSTTTASPHKTLRGVSVGRSRERKGYPERRRLEALDFCDCTSRHFEVALTRFVEKYLRKFSGRTTSTVMEENGGGPTDDGEREDENRGRGRSRGREGGGSRPVTLSRSISINRHAPSLHPARATQFPSVERLCLHGVHFSSDLLSPFILAFPRLTHLDLTGTRIDDSLLQSLSASADLELESLSLARCSRITSECITELLVDSTACSELTELSLEGTLAFPTPLTSEDLTTIIQMAPCMRSGKLRYLDLGGCGVTNDHLSKFHNQSSLIDLGLNASPHVQLEAVAKFLISKAPNVQVLEILDSFAGIRAAPSTSMLKLYSELIKPCTEVPPLSLSEQVARVQMQEGRVDPTYMEMSDKVREPATNLRIIGMDMTMLRLAGGGLDPWRVILGKGRRGWLVDTSSGPDPEAVDEDLEVEDTEEVAAFPSTEKGGGRSSSSSALLRAGSERGRDVRRSVGSPPTASTTWEPETPPRRASHSRSRSRAPASSSSLFVRGASSSHSRSRTALLSNSASGAPPVYGHTFRSSSLAVPPASSEPSKPAERRSHVVRALAKSHPRRMVLDALSKANGHVSGTTGWHSKKMEVLLGLGMLGREAGSYAYAAYQA